MERLGFHPDFSYQSFIQSSFPGTVPQGEQLPMTASRPFSVRGSPFSRDTFTAFSPPPFRIKDLPQTDSSRRPWFLPDMALPLTLSEPPKNVFL